MKKLAYLLVAAGIGVSFPALADPKAIPADGAVSAGAGNNGCELLSENIRVNLSANVVGAFNCNVATNTIWVGTCHNAGSRNPSLTCAQIGFEDDGTTPKFNHEDCDATGTVIEDAADFRGFFAQTSGGSVAPSFLGGSCSATILTAHENLGG